MPKLNTASGEGKLLLSAVKNMKVGEVTTMPPILPALKKENTTMTCTSVDGSKLSFDLFFLGVRLGSLSLEVSDSSISFEMGK